MRLEFATAERIIFGPGTIREAGSLAAPLGRRACLVTGRDPTRAQPLLDQLKQHAIEVVCFAVAGEPGIQAVERGIEFARHEGCDLVIGFGGGSALDAGKAIAAMLANPGELLDYMELIGRGKALTRRSAPYIAIPTTAGSGAEVTRNAVLGSSEHAVKVSLRSPWLLPRIALVDPQLTHPLPPSITASTGLDALTQLIEPYISCRANPMTDALCVDGIRRVARSLRVACEDGGNAAAREDMSCASLFGGLALANAGLGAVHGFAAPIGGMFSAPHGAVCAALLPHVMEINLRALRGRPEEAAQSRAIERLAEIARLLTGKRDAAAEDAIDWTHELIRDLAIPPLSAHGIERSHFRSLVEKAGRASSMKGNPITLTEGELQEILERAL
jgi:alcohol dehydrogenase class IV